MKPITSILFLLLLAGCSLSLGVDSRPTKKPDSTKETLDVAGRIDGVDVIEDEKRGNVCYVFGHGISCLKK